MKRPVWPVAGVQTMKGVSGMKIDIFSHVMPEKYREALTRVLSKNAEIQGHVVMFPPPLSDMSARFDLMDRFPDVKQVLVLAEPAIEQSADAEEAVGLARMANDGMAELAAKYPERFAAAVAALPLNDVDASLKEIDRAIKDLNFRGVLLYSSINGRPLDSEEFLPIYEKMTQYDLPIWIHPTRGEDVADYKSEDRSYYGACGLLGWPHETTVAMFRLACSGVMARFPELKIITHHCGGTAPYLAARVADLSRLGRIDRDAKYARLEKEPVEYLKMFYGDTAIFGEVPALMCGYNFFGADRMLYGTDMPFCVAEPGISGQRQAIEGIEGMPISRADKEKIYQGNARRLLKI